MDLTLMLKSAAEGDPEARASAINAAYDELRKLAQGRMAGERLDHTLSATALVHEVSLKFLNDASLPTENRGKFFAYASQAMRNYLIDYARTRGRQKRGGDRKRVELEDAVSAAVDQREELLALNEALEGLAVEEPRKASVVEMRYFGGLNNQEVADALDISVATVKRDWEVAQTWLRREMERGEAG